MFTLSFRIDMSEQTVETMDAVSDQGLHCLPLIQHIYTQEKVVKWICSDIRIRMIKSEGVRILRVNTVFGFSHS